MQEDLIYKLKKVIPLRYAEIVRNLIFLILLFSKFLLSVVSLEYQFSFSFVTLYFLM